MAETTTQAKPTAKGRQYIWGTGRRKSAIARVRIAEGNGNIAVNGKEPNDYFNTPEHQNAVRQPLELIDQTGNYDVWVNVSGGGTTGQAQAIRLGLARALAKVLPDNEDALRGAGYLTRDGRMKERKKYGRRGARRGFQFSKR